MRQRQGGRDTARARLLAEWAGYLTNAAMQGGTLTKAPFALSAIGVSGPRAGSLELYAGANAPALLTALNRNSAALARQFIPWQFDGDPQVYMAGRYIRVEAAWPGDLAETMIRLADIGKRPAGGGRWLAGKTESGAVVTMGLSDKTPHYLVSGQTGSGKSVALRGAVLQLAQDPDNGMVLVDGKGGEGLIDLAHLPGILGPVATDGPEARAALAWACAEMRRRYEARNHAGRLVVVIDEFQELVGDQTFVDLLRKLCAQGRAAGVHVLAATQHPTVDAFGDSSTRRNLTGKLALRVGDPDASRVAVGGASPRADYLLGAGDCYCVAPGACHRVQHIYTDRADFDKVGNGQWALESWGDADFEAIGQELPEPTAAWSYSGEELAHSIIAAVEDEGRPSMVKRLERAGLGKPGAERGIRLLALGRETKDAMQAAGYWVQYDG